MRHLSPLFSKRKMNNSDTSQAGNIFALLFGAVAVIGTLSAVSMQSIMGPIQTTTKVTQKNSIENRLQLNASIIATSAGTGDSDADGTIEPLPYDPCGNGLVGGGCIPNFVGATLNDIHGTSYGYCTWDHGTVDNGHEDGNPLPLYRLSGSTDIEDAVIALISAGPDKAFQTQCLEYDNLGSEGIIRAVGSDDLVFAFTYAEAASALGGIWEVNSGDDTIAEIEKDIQIKNTSNTVTATINRTTGIGDFFGITTDLLTPKNSIELDIANRINLVSENADAFMDIQTFSDGVHSPHFIVRRAKNTQAAPSYMSTGDVIGSFQTRTQGVTSGVTGAGMFFIASENHGLTNAMGTRVDFRTPVNGSSVASRRLLIQDNGDIMIGDGGAYPDDIVHINQPDGDEGHVGVLIQDPTYPPNSNLVGGRLYYDDRAGVDMLKLETHGTGVAPTGFIGVMRSTGKIGINKTVPLGVFEVAYPETGTTDEEILRIERNNNSGQRLIFENGASGHVIRAEAPPNNAKPIIIRSRTNDAFDPITGGGLFTAFETMGQQRMKITSDGEVGIGTTVPLTDLHVAGDALINGKHIYFGHDGITNLDNDYIRFRDTSGEITGGNNGTIILRADDVQGLTGNLSTPTAGMSVHSAYVRNSLGIADTTPESALDIVGINFALGGGSTATGPDILFTDADGGMIASHNSMHFIIDSNGNSTTNSFTFGRDADTSAATPFMKLDEDGLLRVFDDGAGRSCSIGDGTGNTSCTSDKRLKREIRTFDNPYEYLMASRGVRYKWNEKAGKSYDQEMIGVIAQEVQDILPELIYKSEEDDYLSVTIEGYIPVLIEAAKEAKNRNSEFKQENERLRLAYQDRETRLKTLEALIQQLETQ